MRSGFHSIIFVGAEYKNKTQNNSKDRPENCKKGGMVIGYLRIRISSMPVFCNSEKSPSRWRKPDKYVQMGTRNCSAFSQSAQLYHPLHRGEVVQSNLSAIRCQSRGKAHRIAALPRRTSEFSESAAEPRRPQSIAVPVTPPNC